MMHGPMYINKCQCWTKIPVRCVEVTDSYESEKWLIYVYFYAFLFYLDI